MRKFASLVFTLLTAFSCGRVWALADQVASSFPPVVQGNVNSRASFAVDASGNRYIAGVFSRPLDFNPGIGSDFKTSASNSGNAFVTRYNADGTYAWTQTFGGTTADGADGVAVNGSTVFVTGTFYSTNAKIGGIGTSVANAGSSNVFLIALDAATGAAKAGFGISGSGIQTFGGSADEQVPAIATSGTTVYLTGLMSSTNAKIGGTGTTFSINGTSNNDAFILALDTTTGQPKNFGINGSGFQSINSSNGNEQGIAILANGSTLWVAGTFAGPTTRIGTGATVPTAGGLTMFLASLDASTGTANTGFGINSSGIQTFGGTGTTRCNGLATDGATLFAVGYLTASSKIGGTGTGIGSNGGEDAFVVAIDATSGAAKTSFGLSSSGIQTFGGGTDDESYGAVVNGTTLYVSGLFSSSNAQIASTGPIISTAGSNDAFVLALNTTSGAAKTTFGINSSGVQKFGGTGTEGAYSGLAIFGSNLFVTGDSNSTNASVGGFGPFNFSGFGPFILQLDATTGAPTFPRITSATSVTASTLAPFSYQISSSPAATSYSAANLPSGLTLNTSTGVISGTASSVGTTTSQISVVTASGVASTNISITAVALADAVANVYPPIIQGTPGGTGGKALVTDASGNLYVNGYFTGTRDFNPGVGVDAKISAGVNDMFVTRYNANGTYAWTQTFGGSADDYGFDMEVSGTTVYVIGTFSSANARIGGAGTSVASSGGNDGFIIALDSATGQAKTGFGLNSSGIQTFGGSTTDNFYTLAVNGNTLYLVGSFQNSIQIGAAGPSVTASGTAACVIALDATTGAAVTSFGLNASGIQKFDGGGNAEGVVISGTTLYVGGVFGTSIQIGGTGPSVAATYAGYVCALDTTTGAAKTSFGLSSSGIQKFGGTGGADNVDVTRITVSGTTLFATGRFSSANAQIGGAGPSVASGGLNDVFVIALDATNGTAKTSFGLNSSGIQKIGSSGEDFAQGLLATGSTLYVGGNFNGNLQIGGTGPSVSTSGGDEAFFVALNQSTGAAIATFGLSSSGIQKFGGSGYENCLGIVLKGSTLTLTGVCQSSNAGVGGTGSFDGTGFGGYLLPLDATYGTFVPAITSQLTAASAPSQAFSYQITASSTPTSYTATGLPGGLTVNASTGVISGTAPAGVTTYSITLSATNAYGTGATSTLVLTVLGDAVAATYPPIIQGGPTGNNQSLALDAAGNRYISGAFSGTRDFNPGVGSDIKVSAGNNDAFVTRYNADGSYSWTQTFGGSDDDYAFGVAVNGTSVYLTGLFRSNNARIGGTGPFVSSISSIFSNNDIFVIALDSTTGSVLTNFGLNSSGMQTINGSYAEIGYSILATSTTVYVSGQAGGPIQVGGSGPVVSTAGGGAFGTIIALDATTGAAKTAFGLNSSGVQTFACTDNIAGSCVGMVLNGSTLFVAGKFTGNNAQIGGSGPTVANTGASGLEDACVFALDATTGAAKTSFGLNGSGIQKFGGTSDDECTGLTLLGSTLYATGRFVSTNAQIGGTGTAVGSSSVGIYDAFVIALDASTGNAKSGFGLSSSGIQKIGGSGDDLGHAITASGTTLYVTGRFASANAQIGGTGTGIPTAGSDDAFIAALDATTGAAKATFGLSSSGIQRFGGSASDVGNGIAITGSTLLVTGGCLSSNANIGGFGSYNGSAFGGFLLTLDVATGLYPATVTISNLNQTYDANPKPVTVSTAPGGLSTSVTYNGSSTVPTNAGTYTVIATVTAVGYSGSSTQTLTINKVTPSITWANPADITYGTALSTTQLNASASVGGAYTYNPTSGTVLIAVNAQTLSVNFIPTDTTNYNNASGNVSINVLKKSLVATASAGSKTYGTTNPVFTGSLTGVVAGDGITATYVSSAIPTTNAGTYDSTTAEAITPVVNDPNTKLANYTLTSTKATLTINKATPSITWSNPADITYGTLLSAFQLNASSIIIGTFNYTPSIGTQLNAGIAQTLSVTLVPTDITNYNNGSANVSINVLKKELTAVADAGSKAYGTTNPTFTGTLTGVVNGDGITASYISSATGSTPVGTYDSTKPEAITPLLSDTNSKLNNYNTTLTKATLTVNKATATVVLNTLNQVYDGTPKPIGATTIPPGLAVTFNYNGSNTAPTVVGSYPVTGTITDSNYQGSDSGTLVISKFDANLQLANLSQAYDGNPKSVGYVTTPPGLNVVTFTYNGSASRPVSAGKYDVVGTLNNANFFGNATGTLTIYKITSPASATGSVGSAFTYTIIVNDVTVTSYFATNLPPGIILNSATGVLSGTPTQAGSFDVALTANTDFGPATGRVIIGITASAPGITSTLTANAVVGTPFDYSITSTGAVPILYTASPLPTWMSQTGSSLSGTPDKPETLSITLTATNSGGQDSKVLVVTVNASGAPLITSSLSVNGSVNSPFSYTLTASGNASVLSANTLPPGLSISNGVISGTPIIANTYNVTVSATNAQGVDTKTLVITIFPEGSAIAPQITSTTTKLGAVGLSFNYLLEASGTGPITFATSTLPSGLTLLNGMIFGAPTVSGNFPITLSASNGVGSDSKILNITIKPAGYVPPVVLSISKDRDPARTNTVINFTALAVANDIGLNLTYTWRFFDAQGSPDGMPLTGKTVPHTFQSPGVNYAVVSVADGISTGQSSDRFYITSLAPNPTAAVDASQLNIANGTTDFNSNSATKINFPDSMGGVININDPQSGISVRSPLDAVIGIAGRSDLTDRQHVTAFLFATPDIYVIQAKDITQQSQVVAQRLLAISQNEVDVDASITYPRSRDFTGLTLKSTFSFKTTDMKKRKDSLSLTLNLLLPGGIQVADEQTIYMGIAGCIVKLVRPTKSKFALKPSTVKDESILPQANTATLSIGLKTTTGVTSTDTKDTIKFTLTSHDLVSKGFSLLGIDNTDTVVPKQIPIECYMILHGVTYRSAFMAQYTCKKGVGTLIYKTPK